MATSAVEATASNWGRWGDCGVYFGYSGADPRFSCVSLGNNTNHAIRVFDLGDWPGIDGAVDNAIAKADAQLSINVYETSTDSVPDVKMFDNFYGSNGIVAWVDCQADNTGTGAHGGDLNRRWCRGQKIRINASEESAYIGWHYALIAHEIGHTIGLRHRDDQAGFMETYPPLGTNFTSHDKNHISSEPAY